MPQPRSFGVSFNPEKDADILAVLDEMQWGLRSAYIRDAIREKVEREESSGDVSG